MSIDYRDILDEVHMILKLMGYVRVDEEKFIKYIDEVNTEYRLFYDTNSVEICSFEFYEYFCNVPREILIDRFNRGKEYYRVHTIDYYNTIFNFLKKECFELVDVNLTSKKYKYKDYIIQFTIDTEFTLQIMLDSKKIYICEIDEFWYCGYREFVKIIKEIINYDG
jgi:hypothetical protein